MKDIINRAERLKEYKNRVNESFKHMRGRHNQMNHSPTGKPAVEREGGGGRRGGGGSVVSNMRRQMRNVQGNVTNEMVFANRKNPPANAFSQVSSTRPSARPERLAKMPLAHRQIVDPSQRRKVAQDQQAEWNRRHRMTRKWTELQGLVSPSAMFATPIEPRHDQYEIDDTSTNLFENPYLITGVDESGNETNFMDFYIAEYTALTSRMEQVLDQLVEAGTVSETEVQQAYDRVLDAEQIIRQAVLRKAAATYAVDIQGFLGGEVYSTDDPEYISAMAMAADANQKMSIQTAIIDEFGDRIGQLPGLSDDDRQFFGNLVQSFISSPYNKWADTQMKAEGAKPAVTGSSPVARLARMNPALSTDVIERSIEQASGAVALSSIGEMEMRAGYIGTKALPAIDSDRITMSLPALMGFLHPKIRERLQTIMNQAVQYPENENPSAVIKTVPGREFNAESKTALQIFKGMVDAVHTDGGMSDVSIAQIEQRSYEGYFSTRHESMVRDGIPDTGNPVIAITNPRGKDADLSYPLIGSYATMAHEIGHHIDSTAMPFGSLYWRDAPMIGDPSSPASRPYNLPLLTTMIGDHGGVPPEIAEKAAFAPAVLAIMNRYQQTVQARNKQLLNKKNQFGQAQLRAFYKYLDAPHEVFARMYEQYMLTQLRDRLQAGGDVPGIKPEDRQRALESTVMYIEKNQGKKQTDNVQYFFEDADFPKDQLEEIFTLMGWKFK